MSFISDTDLLVRAVGLTKNFDNSTAVDGIDFSLTRGEIFGILGPNGAGKSSTMRMIGCVSPPSGGQLSIFGLDPGRDGPAIRARIGVVPQEDTLDTELTVLENLLTYGDGLRSQYVSLARSIAKPLESRHPIIQCYPQPGHPGDRRQRRRWRR